MRQPDGRPDSRSQCAMAIWASWDGQAALAIACEADLAARALGEPNALRASLALAEIGAWALGRAGAATLGSAELFLPAGARPEGFSAPVMARFDPRRGIGAQAALRAASEAAPLCAPWLPPGALAWAVDLGGEGARGAKEALGRSAALGRQSALAGGQREELFAWIGGPGAESSARGSPGRL